MSVISVFSFFKIFCNVKIFFLSLIPRAKDLSYPVRLCAKSQENGNRLLVSLFSRSQLTRAALAWAFYHTSVVELTSGK